MLHFHLEFLKIIVIICYLILELFYVVAFHKKFDNERKKERKRRAEKSNRDGNGLFVLFIVNLPRQTYIHKYKTVHSGSSQSQTHHCCHTLQEKIMIIHYNK